MDYLAMLKELKNTKATNLQNLQNPKRVIAKPQSHSPTKPTIPSSVGFVGTSYKCFNEKKEDKRGSVGFVGTSLSRFSKYLNDSEVEKLERILIERDRLDDNRKSCAECKSFAMNKGVMRCRSGLTPFGWANVFTLHRCKGFKP